MTNVPYTIVRSERKSVALVVDNEARLIVRAPHHVTDAEIDRIIYKKERWILEKQLQVSTFGGKHSPVEIDNGENIMYLGNNYTMLRQDSLTVFIEGRMLIVPHAATTADVIAWLKEEATRVISERASRFADLMGVSYTALNLSDAKTRWGSCSKNNSLNFAWRLIMCPLPAIDYIVVHELSHIVYKNHGEGFWSRVKTVIPNYKEQQDWLALNRKLMEIV